MPSVEFLLNERVFLNRSLYQEAERLYSLRKNALDLTPNEQGKQESGSSTIQVSELVDRLNRVESENVQLKSLLAALESRLARLETGDSQPAAAPAPAAASAAPAKNEDDFDLFGDDDDEDAEEKKRVTAERLAAYDAKKSKKPTLIAKSSVLLDIKVWDDETDIKELEKLVRSVQMDGLVWGTSKLVPVVHPIFKLQIQCVIEDDKVSTEVLEEKLCEFEDYVQSVDIVSFNKI